MIPQEGFKNRPKLLAGSKVEVRSVEDGFQGSWHIAKVLVCDNQIRVVEYENLLRDDGSSEKLVESVKVSAIIDGNIPADLGPSTNYRGLIRPSPPQIVFDKWGLHYGLCVDVYTEDAWWEGVIFDHDDGSEERLVFFPDIGDDMRARVDMLRFTQDWDEATEDWKRRENWVFLELIEEVEQEWPLLVSVKQIWYEVRRKKGFENLKEWTFRMKRIWKGLVLGVISDNFKLTLKEFFHKMNSLEELVQEVLPSLDLTELSLHAVVKSQVDSCESLAVVPFDLDVTSCEPAEEEIQYSEPPGFSKVPSNLYEALSIGSNIKPEGIIGKICSFRKLTPSKHVLKNEWLPAGSDLVHEAEFCPYAITEYYNLYKSSRPPDALKFKARQHLSYMGWKIEFMRLHNGSNKFRYTSPCGEVYFSLYQLCKELSNSLSEEISVIPSTRQFSPAVIENLAYENACSETPPSEATVSGIGSEVLKICSTLPPNADELLSVTSNNKHKILFFTSSEIPEQKINQEAVPAGSDLLSKAEVCANAFTQCLEVYKSGGRTCGVRVSKEIKFNVREHLLCLGWKIKCRINDKGRERIRYIAPNGYSYYSLRKICEHWNTDSSKFPPERTSHSSVREALFSPAISAERRQLKKRRSEPSTSAPPVVEPNYSPQAVHDYYYLPELEQVTDFRKVKRDAKLKQLGLKAKQHLASLNWSFFYSSSGDRKELKYLSPTGKKFHNLRKACQNCLKEGGACVDEAYDLGQRQNIGVSRENNRQLAIEGRCSPLRDSASTSSSRKIVEMSNTKEVRIRKLRFEGDNGVFSLNASMLQSENQNSSSPMANVEKESGTGTGRVLRSSKRVRDVASPLHQTPRTVLSWLMENNVVLPRTKVQYRMKDNSAMAEGRVTRDGIKCSCCQNVFTLGNFEAHAGSSDRQPSANIFLEDGRSLLDCQMQLKRVIDVKRSRTGPRRGVKGSRHHSKNDYICSVCHFGGELVLCDQCPSSFHTDCLGLQEVPEGDWFCPLCCCRICGQSGFNRSSEHFTSSTSLNCEQCQRQYHVGCLNEKCHTKLESYPRGNWFCNIRCEEIFMGLQKLLGKAIPVGMNMLKWTLLKYTESNFDSHDAFDTEELESYSKLNVALSVMHECFEPVKEPSTRRDLVEDVIFCKRSELNRLNFRGFYTVLLERDDELITVATIRVYGEKVAEVPLVATRFPYRRLGMCRILMNELEKKLMELGVERLVLPSVPGVLNTWTTAFGFSMMTKSERLNFLDYTFLDFQGTFMCQKLLQKTPSSETSLLRATLLKLCHGDNAKDPMDLDGNSAVSEVVQSERIEESRVLDQGSSDIPRGDDCSDGQIGSKPLDLMENQSSRTECQSQISMAYLVVDSEKECETSGNNGSFKCYKRRKMAAAYGS